MAPLRKLPVSMWLVEGLCSSYSSKQITKISIRFAPNQKFLVLFKPNRKFRIRSKGFKAIYSTIRCSTIRLVSLISRPNYCYWKILWHSKVLGENFHIYYDSSLHVFPMQCNPPLKTDHVHFGMSLIQTKSLVLCRVICLWFCNFVCTSYNQLQLSLISRSKNQFRSVAWRKSLIS